MVSVVIPSYNSENTIKAVLQALYNQSYDKPYEIILVDSSDDRTPEIVKKEFPDVIFFHYKEKTDPGTARNKGVELSRGDPVLFIDSDCRADKDWIYKMVSLHQTLPYEAIGGSVWNGNDPKSYIAWAGYMAEFREFIPGQPTREVEHIPTCNISYKRKVFENNIFNSRYYPQEDLDFNYRLRQNGGRILFNPEIIVFHHHRESIRDFMIHQYKVGEITSYMLKILPLQGHYIVRNKLFLLLLSWFLPPIKWIKTVSVFIKKSPLVFVRYFPATIILAFGLIPWFLGFLKSGFSTVEK